MWAAYPQHHIVSTGIAAPPAHSLPKIPILHFIGKKEKPEASTSNFKLSHGHIHTYPPPTEIRYLPCFGKITTSVNLLPTGAEVLPVLVGDVGASGATSSAGLSMSMSLPNVWLAADAGAPPGDAYLATGLFGIAAAAIAVGTG